MTNGRVQPPDSALEATSAKTRGTPALLSVAGSRDELRLCAQSARSRPG